MKTIALFSLLCLTAFVPLFAQRIEPLNWWVGMKNPNLQLLINAEAIGETTPHISYPGVTIKKITKADSKNYLFVDLIIAKSARPGTFPIQFRKGAAVVLTANYSLLARQQSATQFKGFTPADVIYLLVPDRFANGDPTNDVVAGMNEATTNRSVDSGRHGGDLRGIIDHLDYIADMGYTAIWPTPLLENNMAAYSYHGYSITNHYRVDPRFGTLDDYKELATKAKQKGLKLIYDEVLNHIGVGYWWMNDLPFKNWLNYPDTLTLTNHRRTVNHDAYASAYDQNLMANGWFDRTMPDMNARNEFMANYLIQNTLWWIETLQLGGVRQDTYGYSDKAFLTRWSCQIMNEYPNFSLVGEEWSVNPLITSYWQRGKQNRDDYQSCLTTIMDFPIQEALVQALTEPEVWGKGLPKLYEALANDFVYADPNNMLVLGDNHDMDRLFTQLNNDVALTKMALTYLLTIRGIPQLYYGTETLMENTGHHKVDGLIRSDFPGGWPGDTVNAFTGQGLTPDQQVMLTYTKHLLNWRKNNPVIATGNVKHFSPFDGVYVYFRYTTDKTVMVVMNKKTTDVAVDTKRFAEMLNGKTVAKSILTKQAIRLVDKLPIPAKTALIFEIE
ncbi:glycoside hydrolase family 13 protein [Spirosoma areae]